MPTIDDRSQTYRKVVNSSNIETVMFDESNSTVFVRFKNGSCYEYYDVPTQDGRIIVATAEMEQISTGQLVNRFLKEPKLRYQKLR